MRGSRSSGRNFEKGYRCEDLVARHFEKQGWQILARNCKLYGTEIDLILIKGADLYKLVEVKSLKNRDHWHFRLRHQQKRRLQFVQQKLIGCALHLVELELALVTPEGEIFCIPITG